MKICIDPGHGGIDSGAIGPTGLQEKFAAADIAFHLECGLTQIGHAVFRTRINDTTLSLEQRCEIANEEKADLFLSVHCNAAENPAGHGFEVWTSPGLTAADAWATRLYLAVREAFPHLAGRVDMSDGDPDKESKFYVLVHTVMPAVLIETAFISNPAEEKWLLDPGWRIRMAGAIVSGVNHA